jgi:hypothetical protein
MSEPVKGKVAKVIGPRDLLINKGSDDGVHEGMRFVVLDLSASNVTDPDTLQSLGSLRLEKIRVQVVRVEPRLSMARTYEIASTGFAGLSNISQILTGLGPTYKTFRGESANWDESSSVVKRGDTVEEIIEAISHRVIDTVPVYDSPDLGEPVHNLKAVILETVEGDAKTKGYYPTAKNYRPGSVVSWDWNVANRYGPKWYKGSKGQALKAWDRSAEFVGKELAKPEI